MNIPLADLKAQHRKVRSAVQTAVRKVFERGDFILGEDVRKLEEEFARFCGARFAVGVDSGTGALELALHALNIGPGDEVIVPVFTFYATAFAVCAVGAKPVFVDVEDDTANISPEKIERAVTSKTRAVIPVHLFGQPSDMNSILSLAKKRSFSVIEDAAQAHGAQVKLADDRWHPVGALGDMGCFSFYPAKNLGACGDGGMVTTNSDELNQQLRLYRDCGRIGRYEHALLGHNRRLDTLQAAILRVKLKQLNTWNRARQKKADLYDRIFSKNGIRTLQVRPFAKSVRHVYAVRVPRRNDLADFLKQNGVASAVYYPAPLHLQKCFAFLGHAPGDFPVAEKIASEILALPIFPELKESDVKKITALVEQFYD